MKYYDVIRVSNQNTSFDVVGGEVGIGKDNNGSYVIINDKKIYGLSRIEHICQVKVVNEQDQKKLKAFEIIKEKPIVALVDYKYTYEEWLELVEEKDKDLFESKEEYDLIKEVLL